MKAAIRLRDNGEIYVMDRGASGDFEFGDPKLGDKKHHAENVIRKTTLDEAITAIRAGLHPRMKGQESGQWNMISPTNVKIIEVPK